MNKKLKCCLKRRKDGFKQRYWVKPKHLIKIGEGMQVNVYKIPNKNMVLKKPKSYSEIKRKINLLNDKEYNIMFGKLPKKQVIEEMYKKKENLDRFIYLGGKKGFAKIEKRGNNYLQEELIPGSEYLKNKSDKEIKRFFRQSVKINQNLEKKKLKNTFNPIKDYGVDSKMNVKLFDYGEIRSSNKKMKKKDYFQTETAKKLKGKKLKIYRQVINESIL